MFPQIWLAPRIHGEARTRIMPLLREIEPKVVYSGGLVPVTIPDGDPRVARMLDVLHEHGVRRWVEAPQLSEIEKSPNGYYILQRTHGYDDADYANAEYFWIPDMDGGEWDAQSDGDRGPDGMLLMMAESLKPRARLMSNGYDLFIVSAQGRKEMEEEGFVGLGFHPTKQCKEKLVKGVYTSVPHDPAPERVVWELRPTIELPPMHSEVLRTFDGNSVALGYQGPMSFTNEGFDDTQLVYARSAISRVAPLDIAHAWEWRVGDGYRDPAFPIIVSQRFYKYCKAKKIPAKFIPVKIAEGE